MERRTDTVSGSTKDIHREPSAILSSRAHYVVTVPATNRQPLKTITLNASAVPPCSKIPTRRFITVIKKAPAAVTALVNNNKNLPVTVPKPTEQHASLSKIGSHIPVAPLNRQALQQPLYQLPAKQTPLAANNNLEVRIPKPTKRHASVLSENGSQIIIPPAPLKRQVLIQQPTLHQSSVNQVPNNFSNNETRNESICTLPLPVKLYTPAVKKFNETKNLSSEATDFSPVTCENLLRPASVRKTKLSLSIKNSSAPTTPTTVTSTNQDEIKLPGKSLEEILQEMLPPNYTHKIESLEPMKPYHKNSEYDQSEMLTATVRLNLRNKEEALQWLQDYQNSSLTDWRVRKCFTENTDFVIFKKGYRCSHNTQAQYRKGTQAHKKHTSCEAYLSITVKNFDMKKSKDKFLKTHPCVIVIHHCHNHPIEASDVLRFRRPNPHIVDTFLEMYRKEHSPSSALSTHQYDIQMKHPEDWFEILADGAACPNLQWCYHLYRKTFLKEYGPASGEGMVESLSGAIEKYNAESGSVCAVVKKFQETDLIVALCSPLMKRVHRLLKSSGEVNFLDSGGSMDRHNSRVFTILAPSVAGALPLGMIITSSESEDVLSEGMTMLQSIMPPDAFYDRGPTKGPQVMMTDDSKSERNTLKNCFPGIVLLLCFFHILQAFWTYVWDNKHKVDAEEKEEVFFIFKEWCTSKTKEEFEKRFHDILSNPLYSKNSFLVKQVKGLFVRASEWALCYRSELLIRGNNTNNYSEITILQFKQQVMNRVKAYSVVQLFDFFTSRLESYFERRIAAVVNNRKENYYTSKHYIQPEKLKPLQCAVSSHGHMYVVKNVEKGTKYTVDMQLEICSCPVGFNGAPCKHQFAVAKRFNLSTSQFLPYEDEAAKAILHQIMTTAPAKPGWYAPLKGGPATSNTEAERLGEQSTPMVSLEDLCEGNDTGGIEASSETSEPVELSAEDNERRLALWESISLYISNGLKERPEVFGSAVEKFASQFNKAKALSENLVLSAMHTFSINSFGSKAMRRGRYMKVNTAAVIRRKYASMSGRKCTLQGRPPKAAFTVEHGYSLKRQLVPSWKRCNQRKGAVPHNLTVRVQNQAANSRKRR